MEPDQLDDPVLYRQELIKTHSRRLKALEIKASKYGLETPVSIEVEIVEIKEKIAALGSEISDLTKYRKLVKERKNKRKVDLQDDLSSIKLRTDHFANKGTFIRIRRFKPNIGGHYDGLYPVAEIEALVKKIETELSRIDGDDYDISLLY